jgi:transposase
MFINTEKRINPSGKTVWKIQICESVREGKKVKKKVLRHVITAKCEEELPKYEKFAATILDFEIEKKNRARLLFNASDEVAEQYLDNLKVNMHHLREESRTVEGCREVYGTLFDDVGFNSLLDGNDKKILKEVVVARIEEPASKRKTRDRLEKDCNFNVSLDAIYRMMDKLELKTDDVLQLCFSATRSLFNDKIDLVFFDVTTLYFESIIDDELRNFGYSKDQKFHQTQVVLAMAVTNEGVPIGYRLFPGNTAETNTLIVCLDEWKKHIDIGQVVFVADRGMFNAKNLFALESAGYEYIVAMTLRRLPKVMKEKILEPTTFRQVAGDKPENSLFEKEIPHTISLKVNDEEKLLQGRIIVTNSAERAKKDKKDRQRILDKLEKILKKKPDATGLISNKGYLKYSAFEGKKKAEINQNKIQEDEKWDGIHGIFTNTKLSNKEVLERYKLLWTIEESFRISKTDLEMRPIFHFNPERIKAHVAICFMSLYLVRRAQCLLRRKDVHLSPAKIQDSLSRVASSVIYDTWNGIKFSMPSKLWPEAQAIYEALGIKRRRKIVQL